MGREGPRIQSDAGAQLGPHGADAWRYLSISWRAPMREPEEEKKPIGVSLPDMTFDQLHELEQPWKKLAAIEAHKQWSKDLEP
jgi:hypothetical protein